MADVESRIVRKERDSVTIRFVGDSGDGMQLAGTQFSTTSALAGNDIATLPDYPAEIRAPAGSLAGVSGFQLNFSSSETLTPGDQPDTLVAMNPAALKTNIADLRKGGLLILNDDSFTEKGLKLAGYTEDPQKSGSLEEFQVFRLSITKMTLDAVEPSGLNRKSAIRCKNFFALGLVYFLYDRPMEATLKWITQKFGKKPDVSEANTLALKAGWNFALTTELAQSGFRVTRAKYAPGTYRSINGNTAIAYGLITAAQKAGLHLFYGSYPITPASDILEELAHHQGFGVRTFQAEDEISAIGASIGAAFGGDIAVTGTSGKTTPATLLGEMVSNAIPDTVVGGNMGVSLLDTVSTPSEQTTAILELSSFQLRYLGQMGWRPDIAVVTNFAPNHLDIHEGMEDYRLCKQQLIVHQTARDVTILNADDPDVETWSSVTDGEVRAFGLNGLGPKGGFVVGEQIVSRQDESERTICSVRDLRVPGVHNQANACAAACAAIAAGVGLGLIAESLVSFRGVEHRLELCATLGGVSFYNDSIATSPERTIVAIKALERPVILIAGGSDKGLDYGPMGKLVSERIKLVVLMGETAGKIETAVIGIPVEVVDGLEEAVLLAAANAEEGDAVLLSPASASFDMFVNFEERGRRFKDLINRLA